MYIVIRGRLSKSLLSLWRRRSCFYTESTCCVHIGGGVRLSILAESLYQRLSKSLLSWWRETGVAAAQQILAEMVEGEFSRLVLSRASQTQCSIFGSQLAVFCDSCVELPVSSAAGLIAASTKCRSCIYSIVQRLRQLSQTQQVSQQYLVQYSTSL